MKLMCGYIATHMLCQSQLKKKKATTEGPICKLETISSFRTTLQKLHSFTNNQAVDS